MNLGITADDIKKFFFATMKQGYVAGAIYQDNFPFIGWKTWQYGEGKFRLIDSYHVTKRFAHSTGYTMIQYESFPVWVMHYGGWYRTKAIHTLKKALKANYMNSIFIGGRGPLRLEDGWYVYENKPTDSNKGLDFFDFQGNESITDTSLSYPKIIGEHWYTGEWLLKHPDN